MDEMFSRQLFKLLTEDYKGINLTRISKYSDFRDKQIIDSIIPYDKSTVFKKLINNYQLMVDIGFGGGFPILPMSHLLPEINFIGIETRNKKVKVVGEIAKKLRLQNVKFNHNRVENILFDVECVCTLKAVGKVYDFLSKIKTTKTIVVFFYKGPSFYDIEADQIELAKKNWEIVENIELEVPGTEKRILIGFKNKNVLHGTNDTKQLVKLSSIL